MESGVASMSHTVWSKTFHGNFTWKAHIMDDGTQPNNILLFDSLSTEHGAEP